MNNNNNKNLRRILALNSSHPELQANDLDGRKRVLPLVGKAAAWIEKKDILQSCWSRYKKVILFWRKHQMKRNFFGVFCLV